MRSFLADTTALVVFFTTTGVLNERFVAGMDWSEVATARAIGAPLMVATARPYGVWRDRVLALAPNGGSLSTLSLDTAALLGFQVPLYAAIIFAGVRGARNSHGAPLVRPP